MNALTVSLTVLVFPAAAFAGGLERLTAASGAGFERSLNRALEELPADVFQEVTECRVADAKPLKPLGIGQGVEMLRPCGEALSRRYGVPVRLEAGAAGVVFQVDDPLPIGSRAMREIGRALAMRHGRLLGLPAAVRRGGAELQARSSLQAVVDRCPVSMVLRKFRGARDFLALYGRCLKAAPGLGITSLAPAEGRDFGVLIGSRAGASVLARMRGTVTVQASDGPASFEIEAFEDIEVFAQPLP